jgi:hypothetical protein
VEWLHGTFACSLKSLARAARVASPVLAAHVSAHADAIPHCCVLEARSTLAAAFILAVLCVWHILNSASTSTLVAVCRCSFCFHEYLPWLHTCRSSESTAVLHQIALSELRSDTVLGTCGYPLPGRFGGFLGGAVSPCPLSVVAAAAILLSPRSCAVASPWSPAAVLGAPAALPCCAPCCASACRVAGQGLHLVPEYPL